MTFIPSSIELAFLWNMEHGLLGAAVQQYLAAHPDHEAALLHVFRLGGNDLIKDLIERGADVTAFQSAEPPADAPLTPAEAALIHGLRAGRADAVQQLINQLEVKPGMSKDLSRISLQEQVLLTAFRTGHLDLLGQMAAEAVNEPPTYATTWRDQVAYEEYYLLAFGIAGALVRNRLVEVDLFDVNWPRRFEHLVNAVEDALNALS